MKEGVVQVGAAILRQKAEPVPKKDIGSRHVAAVLKRMSALLKKEKFGVALAAPQLGLPLRIFVVAGKVFKTDPEEKSVPSDKIFINPELMRLSRKKKEMTEGCLSVRKKYGTVARSEKASVKAQDERGAPFIYHGSGLLAQIFQHECDHLDGVLYVDKAIEIHDESKKEK